LRLHERIAVRRVVSSLVERGAAYPTDIIRGTGLARSAVFRALNELSGLNGRKGPFIIKKGDGRYMLNPAYVNPKPYAAYLLTYVVLFLMGFAALLLFHPVALYIFLACSIFGIPGVIKLLLLRMEKKALFVLDEISHASSSGAET